MGHVAYSPKNRLFEPVSGRFTPIRPTNPRRERHGLPTLATVLPPPASRPTPNQRGEVLCRLSSAGYCLPPTAQLPITERGPISTSEPSISLCTEPGDSCGQIHPFLPTRRRSPVDRSLVAKALNPSLFRHACRMAISHNACSLLDFPEFAQALGTVSPKP